MKPTDLPQRWKNEIKKHLESKGVFDREVLGAADFPSGQAITLVFEDGSNCKFNFTILIEAPELNELGLFTEHCGYHIFPIGGVEVVVETK